MVRHGGRRTLTIAAAACVGTLPLAPVRAQTLPSPRASMEAVAPPLADAPGSPAIGAEPLAAAPEDLVAEVRVVGNETVDQIKVINNVTTRAGRPFDVSVVQRDVRRLASLGWFVDVKPQVETTAAGKIVIFKVVERPTIRYVSYLGNERISDKKLGKQTGLKEGGSVDPYSVQDGRRKILDHYMAQGYNNVQVTIQEGTRPTDQGVIYLINEGPRQRVSGVSFVGNDFVSDARLKTLIKSKKPILGLFKGYVDRERIDGDVETLTEYYRSYGYFQARISRKVDYNDERTKATLTFVISEGPRFKVREVRFVGNTKFEPQPLADAGKVKGGEFFEQAKMEQDAQWVQNLYGSHGYVFADVRPETVYLVEPGQVDVVYHIEEGRAWRVGRVFVNIKGDHPHTRIQTALNRVTLVPGQIMDIRELHASERRLMASSLFNTDPSQGDRPKITYRIPEDVELGVAERPDGPREFRGQSPEVAGPPVLPPPSMLAGQRVPPPVDGGADVYVECDDETHYQRWLEAEAAAGASDSPSAAAGGIPPSETSTSEATPLTPLPLPLPSAYPPQGTLTPANRRTLGTRRGAATRAMRVAHARSQPRSLRCADRDDWPTPLAWQRPAARTAAYPPASSQAAPPAGNPYQQIQIRGQSPAAPNGGYGPAAYSQLPVTAGPTSPTTAAPASAYASPYPSSAASPYESPPASAVSQTSFGGQAVGATGPAVAPLRYDSQVSPVQFSPNIQPPAGSVYPQPLNPHGPLPGYSVDPTSPMYAGPTLPTYPEGTVDVFVTGAETQTGRLMFGAAVNSNAGIVGNIVLDERNFDWTRYPRSWEDIRNATAWRGGGQRFRIDANPGSQVSRYLVSWQQPYLFDRPIMLGLSGSYFTRRYQDWDEERLGGRVSLGYQWVDRDLTLSGSYRGENVNISNPSAAIDELTEVLGDNQLHGFGLTLINDTRDSAFLATQGHYFEIGGEQVIGTFDYPRLQMDFRKYFLLYERPDHSGRHVLSASTTVGYSGTHTPIYEHYFAGGFDTLRGWDFRGASPVVGNVRVGGEFQWINSVQYMFPITADEMLHGVVFSDFGTVEPEIEINDFRVAIGTGLRITVPAMGPAPIALDFAWAIDKAAFDDTQVFSFSLGFSR